MATPPSDLIAALPHWARVAFAARCARGVQGLFALAWPQAEPRYFVALRRAIDLAEQSASRAKALSGLEDAIIEATMAAGAALTPLYPQFVPGRKPGPADEAACYLAAFAAKTAEWAAKAAHSAPADSSHATLEAFVWARDTADRYGDEQIVQLLVWDLGGLIRVAHRGGYRDTTPVPPSVFGPHGGGRRPWWKRWR